MARSGYGFMKMELRTIGLSEAVRKYDRAVGWMKTSSGGAASSSGTGLQRAVADAAIAFHRRAVAVTHVDTGTLRGSHMVTLAAGPKAIVHVRPGSPAAAYAKDEHNRGGTHAFYSLALADAPQVLAAVKARFGVDLQAALRG